MCRCRLERWTSTSACTPGERSGEPLPAHALPLSGTQSTWGESWRVQIYYNGNRVHQSVVSSRSAVARTDGTRVPYGIDSSTSSKRKFRFHRWLANFVLDHYAWRHRCRGLFQMPIAA
jgi:hypothetical protein